MKTIKIKFSGMTGNFNPNVNFITNILKRHFRVEISENPDFLIYSVNSMDYLKYDCVRIFYTPENLVPDFNICDYAIGFSNLDFGDRYIRYPIYLVDSFVAYEKDDYNNDLVRALHKHENPQELLEKKDSFCSFVYSNPQGVICRQAILDALSKYKRVNSGGAFLNNVGGPIDNKLDFQLKHKFSIAFENTSTSGYTTEKIVGAFASGTVPIYWGNPDIEKEFNITSFINCHRYGLTEEGDKEAIERIVEEVVHLDQDEEAYLHMLRAPAFLLENNIEKQRSELEKFLLHIFEQDVRNAFRRNRFYWGERYERKQRIGLRYYVFLRKFIPVRDFLRRIVKK